MEKMMVSLPFAAYSALPFTAAPSMKMTSSSSSSSFSQFFRRSSSSFSVGTLLINQDAAANKKKQQIGEAPLLMLSSPQKPHSRFFFDLIYNDDDDSDGPDGDGDDNNNNNKKKKLKLKLNREIVLQEMVDHYIIGSAQGFLISIDTSISKKTRIHATNPLTGATLPLPSTPAISHLKASPHFNESYVFCNTWTSPPREPILLDDHFEFLVEGKAILSPSLTTIFVTMTRLPPLIARLRSQVDTSWTSSEPHPFLVSAAKQNDEDDEQPPRDCIFHKGLLHILWDETLIVIDTDNPLSKPAQISYVPFPACSSRIKEKSRFSLAESPDGEDLFLVGRIYFRSIDCDYPNITQGFNVYKLLLEVVEGKKRNYVWKEMKCMGDDVAMIVSNGATMAFSVSGLGCCSHGFRPNCIYFANEHLFNYSQPRTSLKPVESSDTGVYDLGDNSIEFIELTDGVHDFTWPFPIWYMPSPSSPPPPPML